MYAGLYSSAYISRQEEAIASHTTDEHERIVRRYYEEVFTQRNLAVLEELFAPAFVGHSASSGTYTPADMRRDIAREHEAMPGDETIIEEQVAEADRVLTHLGASSDLEMTF